jgi:hypothetical protein
LGTRGHGILVERGLCDCAGELEGDGYIGMVDPPGLRIIYHDRIKHNIKSTIIKSQSIINDDYYYYLIITTTNNITTMSSPATQYVYIPNLVGRQMLRIPLDQVEAEGQIHVSSISQSTKYTPVRTARESSPSPSVSSVDESE